MVDRGILARGCCRRLLQFLFVLCVVSALSTSVMAKPIVYDVGHVFYGGRLWVVGWVTDPDEDPTGTTVELAGDVQATLILGQDHRFVFQVDYAGLYGEATVYSVGHDGEVSNTVDFDFSD